MNHRQPSPQPDGRSPLPWIGAALVTGIVIVVAVNRWEPDETAVTNTTAAPLTTPLGPTSVPSAAPATEPEGGAATGTTSSRVSSTTSPSSTTATPEEPVGLPDRAIAQHGLDIAWVDAAIGSIELAHADVFEASWAGNMALGAANQTLYYHLMTEDYWFSCESATGEVVILDLTSGQAQSIARGRPALSPDGERLAYLTADECYPDPVTEGLFLTRYDSLVLADRDGTETLRMPLDGEGDTAASLTDLVWLDANTVLVADEAGAHFRIPVDLDEPTPIREHEPVELPELSLYAVVEGVGLGARIDPATGPGSLLTVDLGTGHTSPLAVDTGGSHAVGVSADNRIIISTLKNGSDPVLLVDVDLTTGSVATVVEAPQFLAIDW